MAGGGAASELLEELVLHGFTPSVGVVSVFDTDYITAQRYELDVLSAPPFQPFPAEAVRQMEELVAESRRGGGGPGVLQHGKHRVAEGGLGVGAGGPAGDLPRCRAHGERDLTGGEATSLVRKPCGPARHRSPTRDRPWRCSGG